MSDEFSSIELRFKNLEQMSGDLRSSALKLESRLDIFHQEFQRAATVVHRLGLAQAGAKTAAERREVMLTEIRERLARIETALARK